MQRMHAHAKASSGSHKSSPVSQPQDKPHYWDQDKPDRQTPVPFLPRPPGTHNPLQGQNQHSRGRRSPHNLGHQRFPPLQPPSTMETFEHHLPPSREGSTGGHRSLAGDMGSLQSGQYASLQQHGGSAGHRVPGGTIPSIRLVTDAELGRCLPQQWAGRIFQKVISSVQAMLPEHLGRGGRLHHPLWKEGPYLHPSPHHHQM